MYVLVGALPFLAAAFFLVEFLQVEFFFWNQWWIFDYKFRKHTHTLSIQ